MDSLHGIQDLVALSGRPKILPKILGSRVSITPEIPSRSSIPTTTSPTGVWSFCRYKPWKSVTLSESSRQKHQERGWNKHWFGNSIWNRVGHGSSGHQFKPRLKLPSRPNYKVEEQGSKKEKGLTEKTICKLGGVAFAGKSVERIIRKREQTSISRVAGTEGQTNDEQREEAATEEEYFTDTEVGYEDLSAVLDSEFDENGHAVVFEGGLEGPFETSEYSDSDLDIPDHHSDEEAAISAEPNNPNIDRASLVAELCKKVQFGDGVTISTEDIAALYEFPIDRFQRLAINAFLRGSSLVVCAPTSSGKTLIAEAASAATLSKGQRLFYTTPLKALSNQKLREFREMFGEANVGLLTGDVAVNREAPIMVMTTEILRNMLYQSPPAKDGDGGADDVAGRPTAGGRLENVSTVVLDEVHYLSDISRGTVWEETVIYCPKDVQLICLSATVANAEDLAGWIAQVHGPTELVTGTRRPVPLTWHFSTRYELHPLLNEQGTKMNWRLSPNSTIRGEDGQQVEDSRGRKRRVVKKKLQRNANGNISSNSSDDRAFGRDGSSQRRSGRRGGSPWEDEFKDPAPLSPEALQLVRRRQVPRVQDTLDQLKAKDMLPAIWFIFSRRGCDTAVRYLQDVDLLGDEESEAVREAIAKVEKENPDAVRRSAVAALRRGIAAHHAGCLPAWKSFVEELFQRGLVKVVFATETLAAGINMPARTTVLSSLSKRGEAGHTLLTTNAMLQMAGRAGRRGIDEHGHVVVVQTPFEGPEDCCNLLFAGVDPLVSQFSATYGMALNLLAGGKLAKSSSGSSGGGDLPSVPFGRSLEDARELIERSFGNYVGSEVMHAARRQAAKLEDEMDRLAKRAHAASSSEVLESKLTKLEMEEYVSLRDQVRMRKGDLERMLSEMDISTSARSSPVTVDVDNGGSAVGMRGDGDDGASPVGMPRDGDGGASPVGLRSDGDNGASPVGMRRDGDNGASPVGIRNDGDNGAFSVGLRDDGDNGASPVGLRDNGENGASPVGLQDDGDNGASPVAMQGDGANSIPEGQSATGQGVNCDGDDKTDGDGGRDGDGDVSVGVAGAVESLLVEKRREISTLRKLLKKTQGYREHHHLMALQKSRLEKIARLANKATKIRTRIKQMAPSGWKEFLRVVEVLNEVEAMDMENRQLLPLGQTASAIRGTNELWLAMVFTSDSMAGLTSTQLAAVCGSLVSEGLKPRSELGVGASGGSLLYEASTPVHEWLASMEPELGQLELIQSEHGVQIPCHVDIQFAGMVEAWAAGLTWRELTSDCGMDEGDVARLLRRSIDLLAQISHMPHVSPELGKLATQTTSVMDRPPISDLL